MFEKIGLIQWGKENIKYINFYNFLFSSYNSTFLRQQNFSGPLDHILDRESVVTLITVRQRSKVMFSVVSVRQSVILSGVRGGPM